MAWQPGGGGSCSEQRAVQCGQQPTHAGWRARSSPGSQPLPRRRNFCSKHLPLVATCEYNTLRELNSGRGPTDRDLADWLRLAVTLLPAQNTPWQGLPGLHLSF